MSARAAVPSRQFARLRRYGGGKVARLISLGIQPVGNTPAEYAAIVAKERLSYREAVDAAGLKMEE